MFVHGCFWHGHHCPRGARQPRTNADYWRAKIARNRARDGEVVAALTALGWRVATVWECELRDAAALEGRLSDLLGPACKQQAGVTPRHPGLEPGSNVGQGNRHA